LDPASFTPASSSVLISMQAVTLPATAATAEASWQAKRAGQARTFAAEANVRLVDAGALAEAPFANGRGHALVGGRCSYTAALVSLLAPGLFLDYRDYQARIAYDLSPRDRITLLALGAYDVAGQVKNDGGIERRQVFFASEFHRFDIRYDHSLGEHGRVRMATTLGLDRTRLEGKRYGRDAMLIACGRFKGKGGAQETSTPTYNEPSARE